MLKLFVFLSIASAVSAAENVCKTGNIVNRLVNSKPYYWPATWNETQSAPRLEKGQSCSWTVTIPKGNYAKLIINGKTNDKDSRFQTVDSAGNFVQTTHEKMEPYYFPPTKFTIAVSNDAAATFAFKIEWLLLPTQASRETGVGAIANLINATSALYYIGYDATGGISLLTFPENQENYFSLRSALVFEGQDIEYGNYISNLYLLYETKKQYLSNTHSVMIVNLEASNNKDLLLIQAAPRVKDLNYVELFSVANSNYSVTVDSKKQKSALVTVNNINQTLIDVEMDDISTVTIYYGSPDPFTLGATYNGTEFKNALPINYYNYGVVEFIVNAGKAIFTFQA